MFSASFPYASLLRALGVGKPLAHLHTRELQDVVFRIALLKRLCLVQHPLLPWWPVLGASGSLGPNHDIVLSVGAPASAGDGLGGCGADQSDMVVNSIPTVDTKFPSWDFLLAYPVSGRLPIHVYPHHAYGWVPGGWAVGKE